MQKFDVQIALEDLRDAKRQWANSTATFNTGTEMIMTRLLHEAANNFMSIQEVANHAGLTTKRVRVLMRKAGLNPRDGKGMLAKTASEALHSNAKIMGIAPRDMDLLSPLAYLPMGDKMMHDIKASGVSQVKELPEEIEWDESGVVLLSELVDDIHDQELTSKKASAEIARALLDLGWHK